MTLLNGLDSIVVSFRNAEKKVVFNKNNLFLDGIYESVFYDDASALIVTPDIVKNNQFKSDKKIIAKCLAHHKIWTKVATGELGNRVLILEDEAVLDQNFVDSWNKMSNNIPDAGLIYVGGVTDDKKDLLGKITEPINEFFARIKESEQEPNGKMRIFNFCTYSYILTKDAAKKICKLIDKLGFFCSVDELLMYLYELITINFTRPLLCKRAINLIDYYDNIVHNISIPSPTNDLQECTDVILLSYDNQPDNDNTKFFINTLDNNGWKYKIVGEGEKWLGFKTRMTCYIKELSLLPDSTLVILSDARDVVCVREPDAFKSGFLSFGKKIVVSTELFCNGKMNKHEDNNNDIVIISNVLQGCQPLTNYWKYYDVKEKPHRAFANMGLISGYAVDLKNMLMWIIENKYSDDQFGLGNYMNTFPENVYADSNALLLHTSTFGMNGGVMDIHIQKADSPKLAEFLGCGAFFIHLPRLSISNGQKYIYDITSNIIKWLNQFNRNDDFYRKNKIYSWDESFQKSDTKQYHIICNESHNKLIKSGTDINDNIGEVLCLTYDNMPTDNTKFFINSLDKNGWKYKIVGGGEKWEGFVITRVRRYLTELMLLPDNTLVILSDARDVACVREPDDFKTKFLSFGKKIVVSMELFCDGSIREDQVSKGQSIPLLNYWKYYNIREKPHRKFANMGLVSGLAKDLIHMLSWILENKFTNDQLGLCNYINRFPKNVYADINAILLHSSSFGVSSGAVVIQIQSQDSPELSELLGYGAFFLHIPGIVNKGQKFVYDRTCEIIEMIDHSKILENSIFQKWELDCKIVENNTPKINVQEPNIITSKKKYICLNNYYSRTGLNDIKDRFTEFLKMGKILNLIPILPKLYLTDSHTKRKNSLLIDYINIPDFVCKEMPLNTDEIFYWNLTEQFIPNDKLYKQYQGQIQKYKLNLTYLEKYKTIAVKIVEQMKRPICVVHVRRGDYLNIHESLKITTSPNHIKNILSKHKFNDCYIKTNENDLSFFNELKEYFDVKFFSDFPILKSIYEEGDNYALYSIECCIRDLCDIKISTFNTTKSEPCWLPNNDTVFFNDYLDEHKGYQ